MRLPFRRRRSPAARAYERAKPAPPGTPWREARFAVVDLEMTGLDPKTAEIISFAAVPVEGGRVRPGAGLSFNVRPERMPTADTIRIHGLRPADLEDAPPMDEVIGEILGALAGRVLVAHPSWVERDFLNAAMQSVGTRIKEPVVCTATLAGRLLEPSAETPREIALADAVRALGLPVHDPHTAEGDALTTAQLLIALATRLDLEEPQSVGSLADGAD